MWFNETRESWQRGAKGVICTLTLHTNLQYFSRESSATILVKYNSNLNNILKKQFSMEQTTWNKIYAKPNLINLLFLVPFDYLRPQKPVGSGLKPFERSKGHPCSANWPWVAPRRALCWPTHLPWPLCVATRRINTPYINSDPGQNEKRITWFWPDPVPKKTVIYHFYVWASVTWPLITWNYLLIFGYEGWFVWNMNRRWRTVGYSIFPYKSLVWYADPRFYPKR